MAAVTGNNEAHKSHSLGRSAVTWASSGFPSRLRAMSQATTAADGADDLPPPPHTPLSPDVLALDLHLVVPHAGRNTSPPLPPTSRSPFSPSFSLLPSLTRSPSSPDTINSDTSAGGEGRRGVDCGFMNTNDAFERGRLGDLGEG